MEMVMSGDIFQAKVNELLGGIEVVKAYINDILFLKNEPLRITWNNLEFFYHLSARPVWKSMPRNAALD